MNPHVHVFLLPGVYLLDESFTRFQDDALHFHGSPLPIYLLHNADDDRFHQSAWDIKAAGGSPMGIKESRLVSRIIPLISLEDNISKSMADVLY